MPATFDEWVQAAFAHPVREPEWYWDESFDEIWDSLGLTRSTLLHYMNRLFREPEPLARYSLEQVAQGIWFTIGEASPSGFREALLQAPAMDEAVPCIASTATFFREFVLPATSEVAQLELESDPFQIACWMWWDIFPLRPFRHTRLEGERQLHKACLRAMAEILELPSELCQLSALHGLSHWHESHPEQTETIIDKFLRSGHAISSEVREFAASARAGDCL